MTTKTYRGSCRCGKLRYEVELDLSKGTTKCNCTYCWKARWWGAPATADTFRLLSGGEGLDYGFRPEPFVRRALCTECGTCADGNARLHSPIH